MPSAALDLPQLTIYNHKLMPAGCVVCVHLYDCSKERLKAPGPQYLLACQIFVIGFKLQLLLILPA